MTTSFMDTKTVMYADDAQFLHLELPKKLTQLQTRVQPTLKNAQRWFTDNSLKISLSKTDLVLVKHRPRRDQSSFGAVWGGQN